MYLLVNLFFALNKGTKIITICSTLYTHFYAIQKSVYYKSISNNQLNKSNNDICLYIWIKYTAFLV